MCSPSVASTRCGESHGSNGPRSSAHWKVEPPIDDEKTNRAGPVTISPSGPMSIVVSGASTTVKYQRAGVVSTFIVWSFGSTITARTRKMWSPSARPEARYGFSHSENCSPSIAHSKIARLSLAVKKNGTVASPPGSGSTPAVSAAGPSVIVVSRPVESMTVHSQVETGASSSVNSSSSTATWNVCGPSGSPL